MGPRTVSVVDVDKGNNRTILFHEVMGFEKTAEKGGGGYHNYKIVRVESGGNNFEYERDDYLKKETGRKSGIVM